MTVRRDTYGSLAIIVAVVAAMFATDGGMPDWVRRVALSVAVVTTAAFVYGAAASPVTRLVMGRGLAVIVPVFVIVTAVVVNVVLIPGLETSLKQALVAAIVVAAGWLATFLFQEFRRESDELKRCNDMIEALRVEIEAEIHRCQGIDWSAQRAKLAAGFDEAGSANPYLPFIPVKRRERIVRRIVDSIEILETEEIAAVLDYFHLVDTIDQTTESFDSKAFRDLSEERSEKLLTDWLDAQEKIEKVGHKALKSLRKIPRDDGADDGQ